MEMMKLKNALVAQLGNVLSPISEDGLTQSFLYEIYF